MIEIEIDRETEMKVNRVTKIDRQTDKHIQTSKAQQIYRQIGRQTDTHSDRRQNR